MVFADSQNLLCFTIAFRYRTLKITQSVWKLLQLTACTGRAVLFLFCPFSYHCCFFIPAAGKKSLPPALHTASILKAIHQA